MDYIYTTSFFGFSFLSICCLLLSVIFSPAFAFAEVPTLTTVVNKMVILINVAIPFLIGVGVFAVIAGLLKYVAAGDNIEKLKEGRMYLVYGVLAVVVMVSFWGLVTIVKNSLLGS